MKYRFYTQITLLNALITNDFYDFLKETLDSFEYDGINDETFDLDLMIDQLNYVEDENGEWQIDLEDYEDMGDKKVIYFGDTDVWLTLNELIDYDFRKEVEVKAERIYFKIDYRIMTKAEEKEIMRKHNLKMLLENE